MSHGILPATPMISQHSLLGRLTPEKKTKKKKQKLNNKQGTEN
jgi:hypothetical protein